MIDSDDPHFKLMDRFCRMMEQSGHTYATLYQATGLTSGAVSKWQTGDNGIRMDSAARMAKAFGLTLVQFIDGVYDAPTMPTPVPKPHPRCKGCKRQLYRRFKGTGGYPSLVGLPWVFCRNPHCKYRAVSQASQEDATGL